MNVACGENLVSVTRRPLALALCAREAVPRCLARPGPMNVALKIVRFAAYPRLPEDTIFPAAAHTPLEWWSTAIGRALPVLHQRYRHAGRVRAIGTSMMAEA